MKIILLSILILSQFFVFAQQNNVDEEEVFLKQLGSSFPPLQLLESQDFINNAQIQQVGNNNNVSIGQTLTGTNVPGNIAELIQSGDFNSADLTQNGSGNTHSITQTGNSNMFEATIIGENNSSTIEQFGNENEINQNLIGSDMTFILSQIGNNNEIVQFENDQLSRQYQISQNGIGMKLIITNGGVIP